LIDAPPGSIFVINQQKIFPLQQIVTAFKKFAILLDTNFALKYITFEQTFERFLTVFLETGNHDKLGY